LFPAFLKKFRPGPGMPRGLFEGRLAGVRRVGLSLN